MPAGDKAFVGGVTTMQVSEVSLEFVQKQDEALKSEISKSKIRTLIALLSSSFLLFYWFDSVGTLALRMSDSGQLLGAFSSSFRVRSLALIPIMANSIGWLTWGMYTYLTHFRLFNLNPKGKLDMPYDETGYRDILDQYQLTKINYRRQTALENPVMFLVAIQLVSMGVNVILALR
jgi:hypothetical protein